MKLHAIIAMLTVLALWITCASGCGMSAEEMISGFNKIISVKATPQSLLEAEEYVQAYAKKLPVESASTMVAQLEDYILQYINTDCDSLQVQSLSVYFDKESGVLDEEKVKDAETKEYYETLQTVHIRPVYFEDQVQLRVNYTTLGETYVKEIDPALAQLYEIKVLITDSPATMNATLQIGYDQLLARALSVELLIDEHRDNVLISEDVQWLYSVYLDLIMMGTTNSPIFDYETGIFNPQAREAYEAFLREHSDTTIAWTLQKYFEYLSDINYAMDYGDSQMSKLFFDFCHGIRTAAEKRVFVQNEVYK